MKQIRTLEEQEIYRIHLDALTLRAFKWAIMTLMGFERKKSINSTLFRFKMRITLSNFKLKLSMLSLHQRKGRKTFVQNSSALSERSMTTYDTACKIAFQLPFQLAECEQVTSINTLLCINNFNDGVDGIVGNIKRRKTKNKKQKKQNNYWTISQNKLKYVYMNIWKTFNRNISSSYCCGHIKLYYYYYY